MNKTAVLERMIKRYYKVNNLNDLTSDEWREISAGGPGYNENDDDTVTLFHFNEVLGYPEEFIEKYIDKFDYTRLKVSNNFILKHWDFFKDKIKDLFYMVSFSEEVLERIFETCKKEKRTEELKEIGMIISKSSFLSYEFIKKHWKYLDKTYLLKYQELPLEIIESILAKKGKHSEEWENALKYQIFSESFFEKYEKKIEWEFVVKYQILSEPFIEKYADKLGWEYISQYQKLSEDFIDKYKDYLDFEYLSVNKRIPLNKDFLEKYKDELFFDDMVKERKFSAELLKFIAPFSEENVLYGIFEANEDEFSAVKYSDEEVFVFMSEFFYSAKKGINPYTETISKDKTFFWLDDKLPYKKWKKMFFENKELKKASTFVRSLAVFEITKQVYTPYMGKKGINEIQEIFYKNLKKLKIDEEFLKEYKKYGKETAKKIMLSDLIKLEEEIKNISPENFERIKDKNTDKVIGLN